MTAVPLENGGPGRPLRIVSFGEVLFDIFDDGARLGGAPLNLAVHLHRLGVESLLVSAVGQDTLGDVAIQEIVREGLPVDHVARVPQPTGSVTVSLNEAKVPAYRFLRDCAYDYIPVPKLDLSELDLFCFGTLAQRGEASRSTLRRLLSGIRCRVFCDVNLRLDFYSKEILEHSLAAADVVKLNDDELPVIASMFGIEPESGAVAKRFGLNEACKYALAHLGKPGPAGANLIGLFRTASGLSQQVLTMTIGGQALWAFSTTTEDVTIRNALYLHLGPSEALRRLAGRFPGGSAKSEVERRRRLVGSAHNADDVAVNVTKELVQELLEAK